MEFDEEFYKCIFDKSMDVIFSNNYVRIIFSTMVIYLFIVIAIRLFGKKELAQLSVVDMVFILLIDPFAPSIESGKLFGLGSNDAGASVVTLLQAFFCLTQKQQAYNLIFAASAEEEVSGKNGIESLLHELPKIDFAIVGEPTQMNLAVAEKGLMVLDCVSTGKAGHAARNEGDNAIYKALKDIEWFRSYDFMKKTDLLGPVKMSVTQINQAQEVSQKRAGPRIRPP